ncbi:MAG: DUF3459 domain-containing protein, partial [Myxococcota bacterium]|nr:DUF3459 domain-containing protein [Myxococcota bacterium]
PAEGILTETEVSQLVECIRAFDGLVTERRRPDGSLSPYEANVSLFDALKGTMAGVDAFQVPRFLVSHAVMLAMSGVPALYYNSVLAAPNNLTGVAETGRNRTINRRKWTMSEVKARIESDAGPSPSVLQGLREMLRVRQAQPAFHPEAKQESLVLHPHVFALVRSSPGQRLLCLFNVSRAAAQFDIPDLPLDHATHLYAREAVALAGNHCTMEPYAILWVSF